MARGGRRKKAGRPKGTTKPIEEHAHSVTVRLYQEQRDKLERLCQTRRESASTVLRILIDRAEG